ncbi:MAG TPA: SMP-30/gluconolactonase/LRE family protein, partial [Thermoleophilia bacterium]|nr:SMP-30/gluconolactonase/LRE family protein [Thermoleophilia bacterium]
MSGRPRDVEAVAGPALLGEGPRWDAQRGVLWWVDIVAGLVRRFEPATGRDLSVAVGDPVSLVLPRSRGGVVVGVGGEVRAIDDAALDLAWSTESDQGGSTAARTDRLVELDPSPLVRTNDGACDGHGRLWVGTMARDERSPLGGLFRVDAELNVTRLLTGTTISNGLGWSPSGDRFYFIDSPTRTVDVFDHDPATGALEHRRPLVTFASEADDPTAGI